MPTSVPWPAMKEWLGFAGVVLAASIAAWAGSGPTLSRRVKHHTDLVTALPADMQEPLRSVLREELEEYAARERGRLHRSWRRLRPLRTALVGSGLLLGTVSLWAGLSVQDEVSLDFVTAGAALLALSGGQLRSDNFFKPMPIEEPNGAGRRHGAVGPVN